MNILLECWIYLALAPVIALAAYIFLHFTLPFLLGEIEHLLASFGFYRLEDEDDDLPPPRPRGPRRRP